jgi:hypothetical protein
MKSLLPASLLSRTVDESNSEKQIPSEEEREETVSSSTTKTIVTTVGEEDLTKTIQPVVETLQKEDISVPTTDYSISDDVNTTDKQSVEQVVEFRLFCPHQIVRALMLINKNHHLKMRKQKYLNQE